MPSGRQKGKYSGTVTGIYSKMSGGVEPMNMKKSGEVIPPPSFGGGPMYDEATARKMLREAVLVDPEFGELTIGFDPEDTALDNGYYVCERTFEGIGVIVTPMTYFARKGDLKMCRYLASRGASTTRAPGGFKTRKWFPLYAAAYGGHLNVCKFLFANGAKSEIRRANKCGFTPLATAALNEHHALIRWLVLGGALCANDISEKVEENRFYPEEQSKFYSNVFSSARERLVEWAEEVTQSHASIITFLHGALPPTPGKDGRCILQHLGGHPGIRKHICCFVGQEVTKKKHLHILRQVKGALSPSDAVD